MRARHIGDGFWPHGPAAGSASFINYFAGLSPKWESSRRRTILSTEARE